jgi:hypothetical protein
VGDLITEHDLDSTRLTYCVSLSLSHSLSYGSVSCSRGTGTHTHICTHTYTHNIHTYIHTHPYTTEAARQQPTDGRARPCHVSSWKKPQLSDNNNNNNKNKNNNKNNDDDDDSVRWRRPPRVPRHCYRRNSLRVGRMNPRIPIGNQAGVLESSSYLLPGGASLGRHGLGRTT